MTLVELNFDNFSLLCRSIYATAKLCLPFDVFYVARGKE